MRARRRPNRYKAHGAQGDGPAGASARRPVLLLAAFLLAAAGCGGGQGGEAASPTLHATISGLGRSLSSNGLVTVAAAGDVNFGDGVTPYLERNGMSYPFAGVSGIFGNSDFSFVNLECCISSAGSPVPGKEYCFRGPPDSAEALALGNVRVVSLANNHSKDYGTQAFLDTLGRLEEAGVRWCGAGRDADAAYSPAVLEARGTRVAFVAFSGVVPAGWPATPSGPGCATTTDRARISDTIREARASADYVVASFHWGIELATSPNAEQRGLARLAVDSGADLILGHHPHVVQGFELYNNRLIAYSLGNYVFSPPREISSKTLTLVALLSPSGLVQARVVPTVITGCRPAPQSGDGAVEWLSTVAGYCRGLGTEMKVSGEQGFIDGESSTLGPRSSLEPGGGRR